MKIYIALLTLFFSVTSNAETWIEISDGSYPLECPDFISFQDNKYEILNDCYGVDPKYPVIETGNYEIEKGFISFFNRKTSQSSFMRGDAKSQKMELHKNKDSIKIIDGSNEYYFKIEAAK